MPGRAAEPPFLVVHFVWPVLASLFLSCIIAFGYWAWGITGVALDSGQSVNRISSRVISLRSIRVLVALLILQSAVYLLVIGLTWLRITRSSIIKKAKRPQTEERLVPLRVYDKERRGRPVDEGFLKDMLEKGREVADRIFGAPPTAPQLPRGDFQHSTLPADVDVYDDEPYSALDELFLVTHHQYNRDKTRTGFELAAKQLGLSNGQALHRKYLDIWFEFGWIEVDGRGAFKSWTLSEPQLYKTDRGLYRTAIKYGFEFPPPPLPQGTDNG